MVNPSTLAWSTSEANYTAGDGKLTEAIQMEIQSETEVKNGSENEFERRHEVYQKNTEVVFENEKSISSKDREMAQLFAETEQIDASSSDITDAGVAHLKGMQCLKILRLSHTAITDKSIGTFKELKNLVEIDLTKTCVSIRAIAELRKNLPNCFIQWSNINASAADQRLLAFTYAPNYQSVELQDTDITGDGLALLEIIQPEYLDISGTVVGEEGLANVSKLKRLKTLIMSNDIISDQQIHHLNSLSVEVLSLNDNRITDASMDTICSIGTLKVLYLEGTDITDQGLTNISKLSLLENIVLNRTNTTDAGLANLAKLKYLQAVDCYGSAVTAVGAHSLAEALPYARIGFGQVLDQISGHLDIRPADINLWKPPSDPYADFDLKNNTLLSGQLIIDENIYKFKESLLPAWASITKGVDTDALSVELSGLHEMLKQMRDEVIKSIDKEWERIKLEQTNIDDHEAWGLAREGLAARDTKYAQRMKQLRELLDLYDTKIRPLQGALQQTLDTITESCKIPSVFIEFSRGFNAEGDYSLGTGTISVNKLDQLNVFSSMAGSIYHELVHAEQDALMVSAIRDDVLANNVLSQVSEERQQQLAKVQAKYKDLTGKALEPAWAERIIQNREHNHSIELSKEERQRADSFIATSKKNPKVIMNRLEVEFRFISDVLHRQLASDFTAFLEELSLPEIGDQLLRDLFGEDIPQAILQVVRRFTEAQGNIDSIWLAEAKLQMRIALIERLRQININLEQQSDDYFYSPQEAEGQIAGRRAEAIFNQPSNPIPESARESSELLPNSKKTMQPEKIDPISQEAINRKTVGLAFSDIEQPLLGSHIIYDGQRFRLEGYEPNIGEALIKMQGKNMTRIQREITRGELQRDYQQIEFCHKVESSDISHYRNAQGQVFEAYSVPEKDRIKIASMPEWRCINYRYLQQAPISKIERISIEADGKLILLKDGWLQLGRSAVAADGSLITTDEFVSSKHGLLRWDHESEKMFYKDTNSSNGSAIKRKDSDSWVDVQRGAEIAVDKGDEILLRGKPGIVVKITEKLPKQFSKADDIQILVNDQLIPLRDGRISIGRGESHDGLLQITDEAVSKVHVTIRYDAERGKFLCEDHSSNGTYIKFAESPDFIILKPGIEVVVGPQDEIRLGSRNGSKLKLVPIDKTLIVDNQAFFNGVPLNLYSGEVKVGRANLRNFVATVVNQLVSKEHGTLRFDNEEKSFYFTDHSTNGTYVKHFGEKNFGRIPANRAIKIYPSDQIRLGRRDGPELKLMQSKGDLLANGRILYRRPDGAVLQNEDGSTSFADGTGIKVRRNPEGIITSVKELDGPERDYVYENGKLKSVKYSGGESLEKSTENTWIFRNPLGGETRIAGDIFVEFDGSLRQRREGQPDSVTRLDGCIETHLPNGRIDYIQANLKKKSSVSVV